MALFAVAATGYVMNRDERRQWVKHVAGCTQLTHAERLVLLMLETFADFKDGSGARPGEQALADLCAVTRRVVSTALTKAARDLKLIEQTHRANPKAHIVATYRLVSVSSSVHIESGSASSSVHIESGFNEKKSGFNEKPHGVSMRSTLHTYPPLIPSTTPPSGGRARATLLAADWVYAPNTLQRISEQLTDIGVQLTDADVRVEFHKFQTHMHDRGSKHPNWQSRFEAWLLQEAQWRKERGAVGTTNGAPTSKPRTLLDMAARDRERVAAAQLTSHQPKGISS